jgi:hypothetical protein
MPKNDHKSIHQAFVAKTDETDRGRSKASDWLRSTENVDRLLDAVASGQSLRRFCEAEGIAYATVQRALTVGDLEPRYRAAQEQMAEHLMGEIERISSRIEDGSLDPKAGAVILDGLKWRITKLNQRRYSDRIVQEQHTFDHTKMHIEAVRTLARQGRTIEHELPALPAADRGAAPLLVRVDTSLPPDVVEMRSGQNVVRATGLAALERDLELVAHSNLVPTDTDPSNSTE